MEVDQGGTAMCEDVVRNIITQVPPGWLEKFGFEQRGRLSRVGLRMKMVCDGGVAGILTLSGTMLSFKVLDSSTRGLNGQDA